MNITAIDSSTLCHELARRINNSTIDTTHSLLFENQSITPTHSHNIRRDGVKLKPGPSKRQQHLKYHVSNDAILREIEYRVYSGSHYAIRELYHAINHVPTLKLHISSSPKKTRGSMS
jgi:hypothetical protein